MKSSRPASLALAASLSASVPVVADAADPTTNLSVPPVVVTANRFEEPAADLPVGVQVITARDIADSGALTLADVLSRQMGLVVRDNSGGPNRQIDLRGFGAFGDQNTLVLVNGQRISENEQTPADLASIALQSIERVEIMRGSGAVLYGSGATGGTINIITRLPAFGERDLQLRGTAGSYGTWGLAASGSAGSESLAVGVDASHLASDNYRRNNDLLQDNLQAALRWGRGDTSATLSASRSRQDLRLPGERTAQQFVTDPRGTSKPDDWYSLDATRTLLRLDHALRRGTLAVDIMHRERHNKSFQFGGFNTIDSRVSGMSPRVRVPFDTGMLSHMLIVGADWENWDFDNRIDAFSYAGRAEQENAGIYVQENVSTDTGTSMSLGARHQRARSALVEGAQTSDRVQIVRAYEVAVKQVVSRTLSGYVRIGRSFRFANVDEVRSFGFGPPNLLEPQTSLDREAGARYTSARADVRVAYFVSRLRNEILFDPVSFTNVNLPPTERRGVEIGSRFLIDPSLVFAANYAWMQGRFLEGAFAGASVGGRDIPLVPRNKADATLAFAPDGNTTLSATATYVGHQRFDNDQTNTFPIRMPSYTVVDGTITREAGRWRLTAAALNVFDRRYYSYGLSNVPASGTFSVYPAAGRAFLFTAEYRLGPS
ncbi:MAG: TonB-dependent receptor [Betaproteobacteria bacterium]|nr:TonB-dependent receptor [Betaproteobacteria bacterium]